MAGRSPEAAAPSTAPIRRSGARGTGPSTSSLVRPLVLGLRVLEARNQRRREAVQRGMHRSGRRTVASLRPSPLPRVSLLRTHNWASNALTALSPPEARLKPPIAFQRAVLVGCVTAGVSASAERVTARAMPVIWRGHERSPPTGLTVSCRSRPRPDFAELGRERDGWAGFPEVAVLGLTRAACLLEVGGLGSEDGEI